MVDVATTPTRSQIAQLVGNDQRLILAMEQLFSAGLNVQNVLTDIAVIQSNITTLQGNTSDNEADIDGINTRLDELDSSSEIGQAEAVVLSTYGDTVSVAAKGKNLNKFGTKSSVGNSFETVAQFQGSVGDETFETTNAVNAIVSASASDTQTIRIEGQTIDGAGNLTFTVQNVTLSGQTPVALSTPLARCTRLATVASGTFGTTPAAAVGRISCYNDADGASGGAPNTDAAVKCVIEAGFTQSEKCSTSISSQDYWFITTFSAGIGNAGGSASRVTFRIEARDVPNGGAWLPQGRVLVVTVGQNGRTFDLHPYIIIPKNHDVRVVAATNNNTAEVFAELRGMLAQVVA